MQPLATRPAPFWQRIAAVLRADLAAGAFPARHALPGEHDLAARFGAARMTLRRALSELEAEGLLRREAGRGTYPTGSGNAAGWAADMRDFALSSRVKILGLGLAVPPPAVMALLAARAIRLERVRGDARGAFSHTLTWLPAGLGRNLPRRRLTAGETVLNILRERGAAMTHAEQTVIAIAAPPEVAGPLDLPTGTALTALDRVARDADGRVIEVSRSCYRPDRFAYSVPLTTEGAPAPPRWVIA
ncbi:GntR family transcriptional regulator [Humitalea sp. 24SJ18S-53]|uniref:GntR family transcriptional regulator n=1 Tax=Humitalea sp. 24SJ18S-53 TaxID=3422307 RepID=UPI003D679BA0